MGRKIPLQEFLKQLKEDMYIISTIAFTDSLVSGSLIEQPGKYYEFVNFVLAIIDTMEIDENKNAYVDITKMQERLANADVNLKLFFDHLDTLLAHHFFNTDSQSN